jgi:hypothetical protein
MRVIICPDIFLALAAETTPPPRAGVLAPFGTPPSKGLAPELFYLAPPRREMTSHTPESSRKINSQTIRRLSRRELKSG